MLLVESNSKHNWIKTALIEETILEKNIRKNIRNSKTVK